MSGSGPHSVPSGSAAHSVPSGSGTRRVPLRGCLVTGTDTGVGKTVVSAAIVAALRRLGAPVRALKPLISGLDDPPQPLWPPDHELLARVAGATPEETIFAGYGPPVSPHLAAELADVTAPSISALAAWVRAGAAAAPGAGAGAGAEAPTGDPDVTMIVEGVGGLLVPLGPHGDVRALAVELELPLLVVARPGLGTINHTLLTLEAARSAGLTVIGVVLTPWPSRPDAVLRSNRETIVRLGAVEVATLGFVAEPAPAALADAGAQLPLDRWFGATG